jgi:hypothetical protein
VKVVHQHLPGSDIRSLDQQRSSFLSFVPKERKRWEWSYGSLKEIHVISFLLLLMIGKVWESRSGQVSRGMESLRTKIVLEKTHRQQFHLHPVEREGKK